MALQAGMHLMFLAMLLIDFLVFPSSRSKLVGGRAGACMHLMHWLMQGHADGGDFASSAPHCPVSRSRRSYLYFLQPWATL